MFPTFAFFCAFLFSLGRFGLPYLFVWTFCVVSQQAFFANAAARSSLASLSRPCGRPWVGLDCLLVLFGLFASLVGRRSSPMLQRVPFLTLLSRPCGRPFFPWVGLDCRTCFVRTFCVVSQQAFFANAAARSLLTLLSRPCGRSFLVGRFGLPHLFCSDVLRR